MSNKTPITITDEDYFYYPTSVEWTRSNSTSDSNNASGACHIVPVMVNITTKVVEFVLIDSGKSETHEKILSFMDFIRSKLYTPKIIGLILSHYDNDHSGGINKTIGTWNVPGSTYEKFKNFIVTDDFKFFAYGYPNSNQISMKKKFTDFFFPDASKVATLPTSNADINSHDDASRVVYQLSYGKLLVRKWYLDNKSTSETPLTVVYRKPASGTFTTPHITLKSVKDPEVKEDTAPANLNSLVTIFFGPVHYVFTGDSIYRYITIFTRWIPRTPTIFNKLKNDLFPNTTPTLEQIYKAMFSIIDHQKSEVNFDTTTIGKAYIKIGGKTSGKFACMEMGHHGSVCNGLPSARLSDSYNQIVNPSNPVTTSQFTDAQATETLKKIVEVYAEYTDTLFVNSAGTSYHVSPRYFPHLENFPLMISYASPYFKQEEKTLSNGKKANQAYGYPKDVIDNNGVVNDFDYNYNPLISNVTVFQTITSNQCNKFKFPLDTFTKINKINVFQFTEIYSQKKYHPILNQLIRDTVASTTAPTSTPPPPKPKKSKAKSKLGDAPVLANVKRNIIPPKQYIVQSTTSKKVATIKGIKKKTSKTLFNNYVSSTMVPHEFIVTSQSAFTVDIPEDIFQNGGNVDSNDTPAITIEPFTFTTENSPVRINDYLVHNNYFEDTNQQVLYQSIKNSIIGTYNFTFPNQVDYDMTNPSIIFRMNYIETTKQPVVIGLLFKKAIDENSPITECVRVINMGKYQTLTSLDTPLLPSNGTNIMVNLYKELSPNISFAYQVNFNPVSGTAAGDFGFFSHTEQEFSLYDVFQIPFFQEMKDHLSTFSTYFKDLIPYENGTEQEVETALNDFLQSVKVRSLDGVCEGTLDLNNYESFIQIPNLQQIELILDFTPVAKLFTILHLESIFFKIGFGKGIEIDDTLNPSVDKTVWNLQEFSIGGMFAGPSAGTDIEVILDLNIGKDAFAIHFYQIQADQSTGKTEIPFNDFHTHVNSNITINEAPTTPFDFSNLPLVGNLALNSLKGLSIYLSSKTYKFAGFYVLIDFQQKIHLTHNIYLTDATIELESVNGNASPGNALSFTDLSCFFEFGTKDANNVEIEIGKLSVVFDSSTNTTVDAKVMLYRDNGEDTSLKTILGYFIGANEVNSLLADFPISDSVLQTFALEEIELKINLTTKTIESFHFNIYTVHPISISTNVQLDLNNFTFNYYNSGQNKLFNLSSELFFNNKELKFLIQRESSQDGTGDWRFIFDYDSIQQWLLLPKYQDVVSLGSDDTFVENILDAIQLRKVHLSYDKGTVGGSQVLFYTEIDKLKLGIAYFQSKINLFFLMQYQLGSKNEGVHATFIDDLMEPIDFVASKLFGKLDVNFKFLRIADYTDDAQAQTQLLQMIQRDSALSEIQSQFNGYIVNDCLMISFECVCEFLNTLEKNLARKDNGSSSTILFSLAKISGEYKIKAAYECNIEFGGRFKIKEFKIEADIVPSTEQLSITLGCTGQTTTRGIFLSETSNILSGQIGVAFNKLGVNVILGIEVDNWFQPFDINWLHIKKVRVGGAFNPETLISAIDLDAEFEMIALEDQITANDINQLPIVAKQYEGVNTGNPSFIFKLKLDIGQDLFDFEINIENLKLITVFRDIHQRDTDSQLLKDIDIQELNLQGSNMNNQLKFEIELSLTIQDFDAFLRIGFLESAGNTSLKAMGLFSPIILLDGRLEIANTSRIEKDAYDQGLPVPISDPQIKAIETSIFNSIQAMKNNKGTRPLIEPNNVTHNTLTQKINDITSNQGAMFQLLLDQSTIDIQVSAGLKILKSYGVVTASISKTKFYLSGALVLGNAFQLIIEALVTKQMLKFSTNIEWDFSLTTPDIYIGSVNVFPSINVTSKFNGMLDVSIDSSDLSNCRVAIEVDFKLNNSIHLYIPKFQVTLSDLEHIASNIVNYIKNNFKDIILPFLKNNPISHFILDTMPNFFKNSANQLALWAKELGHSASEVKDWLIQKLGPDAVKTILVNIYNLASDAADAICGIIKEVAKKVIDDVIDNVKKGWSTVKHWWHSIFGFILEFGDSSSIMYSISGINVNPNAFFHKHLEITNYTVNIVSDVISFIEYNELVFDLSSIHHLKPIHFDIANQLHQSLTKFVKHLKNLNVLDKSKLMKPLEKVLEFFESMVHQLTSLTDALIVDSFNTTTNKHQIDQWFKDGTPKMYKAFFIRQMTSFVKYMILLYNKICPLFQFYDQFINTYRQSPKHQLTQISKLNVMKHLNSCLLVDTLSGNGSVFTKGTGKYIVIDSRIHKINSGIVLGAITIDSLEVDNISLADSDDQIRIGESLENSTLLKYRLNSTSPYNYYLQVNGSIRLIDSSMQSHFAINDSTKVTEKPDLYDYFELQPITKFKSELEGFTINTNSSSIFNDGALQFETGQKSLDDILIGSIIQVSGTTCNLLVVSRELAFNIDPSLLNSASHETITNFLITLGVPVSVKDGRLPVYRLTFEQIPASYKTTISNTIFYVERDRNNTVSHPSTTNPPVDTNNTYEYFAFDPSAKYITENEPEIRPQPIDLKLLLPKLPLFTSTDAFKKISYSEDLFNILWVTNEFIFSFDFTLSDINNVFVPTNNLKYSNLVIKKDLIPK
ncbi:hypothetical protein DLAC_08280 [Tieghemostelium lacteum]|uniref:Uncharacterized protein n=1 Tax=Tieghemostelium lacteum TaxID=361077 RepID=A0A151ZBL0_TIELA|nr:hypothetical protein DLAC_08280 [Tieghemostelium lacteum]|eukprot:KYQ91333.1 hypothetical protein DLAC_08280 [Tieghemostelium lacteum]